MTKTDTKAMKARIDIVDLLVKIGARVEGTSAFFNEEVSVYCPFCSDGTSRKLAGRANPLKGLYHCWSCGFGGDIFDVVRRYLWEDDGSYTPFEDSVMWLEEAFPAEGGDDNPWGT